MSVSLHRGRKVEDNDSQQYGSRWVVGYYVRLSAYKGGKQCISHRIYNGYAEMDCGDLYPDWWNVDPDTVSRFTGKRDHCNQDIFEGDIVYIRCEDEYGVVAWDEDTARFTITHEGVCSDFDNYYGTDLEVVSNIFDEPCFMKGDDE